MIAIALDGPAGAGKSTTAKALAKRLGYLYIDTGAMYRAIGLRALRAGADPADPAGVIPLLADTAIRLDFVDGEQHIFLGDEDVSDEIRRPEASMAASNVSAIPEVRAFLLETQRSFAREHNIIMDGRDIGTVVLPDAQIKIFLTASPEVRARRRYDELCARGFAPDYAALLKEVKQRDWQDSHRAAAPLRQASDAWLCDTTGLDFEAALDKIHRYIQNTLGE